MCLYILFSVNVEIEFSIRSNSFNAKKDGKSDVNAMYNLSSNWHSNEDFLVLKK